MIGVLGDTAELAAAREADAVLRSTAQRRYYSLWIRLWAEGRRAGLDRAASRVYADETTLALVREIGHALVGAATSDHDDAADRSRRDTDYGGQDNDNRDD